MTASYNGFKASPNPADFGGLDNSFVPGTGVKLAPGVRAGDVATVLFYVAAQLDARVEDGDPGQDEWGYSYRASKNSASLLSCHASATAFDWNAQKHPNGRRGTFTAGQVAEIRKILAEVDNLVYWGGDAWGNGTPDEMHFEIAEGVTLEQLAAAAAKIRGGIKPPVPPPAPADEWYRGFLGSRVLSNGCKGDDVGQLQATFASRYPLYAKHLMADGIFGAKTEAVVREFQKRSRLAVDGIVGRKTFRALGF
jgi:murein L,D-transpeptidase YcbB/YkuD